MDRHTVTTATPLLIEGRGFVTDGSHPQHPGDFRSVDINAHITIDSHLTTSTIAIESGEGADKDTDLYQQLDGRIFQFDDVGREAPPHPLGDVSAAAAAALHPVLVAEALRARPENVTSSSNGGLLFAWNEALWSIELSADGSISQLSRATANEVYGDGEETIRFESFSDSPNDLTGTVVVESWGRESARIEFTSAAPTVKNPFQSTPGTNPHRLANDSIHFDELAPHLFKIDLAELDTRVTVAEFADHLIVIEGAYSSRSCDQIAEAIRDRFNKPVRYFAFSHLHGQYIGGVRSWVAEGATILVPPTTSPLITQIVDNPFHYRRDALAHSPKPLSVETVAKHLRVADDTNTVDIYNIESQHTDEYLIFYFPQSKILLTGDLLFYRPGQPLAGRSLNLAQTVKALGLDVETCVATWPLKDTYGTKNIVTRAEVENALNLAGS